jgi:MoaA/NifB/PqqE/SkfB family radical SAM enzyme
LSTAISFFSGAAGAFTAYPVNLVLGLVVFVMALAFGELGFGILALIDVGTDFIGFFFAGATPGTHNVIRANSNLPGLLRSVQAFQEFKASRKISYRKVHMVFLVLRDNLAELTLLVERAKEIGIDEIAVVNLIQVSNAWQEAQRVFTCRETEEHAVLREASSKAREFKIRLRMASFHPHEVGVCAENPLRNLYISADGNVSPCVYLFPPTPSPFTRIYCGRLHAASKVSFGNVFEEYFENIWNRDTYREFRLSFESRRKDFEAKHPGLATDPEPIYGDQGMRLTPPPESCRTCHKMLGV